MMHFDVKDFTLEKFQALLTRFALLCAVLLLWHSIDMVSGSERINFMLPTWIALVEYGFSFYLLLIVAQQVPPQWAARLIPMVLTVILGNYVLNHLVLQSEEGGVRGTD